MQNKFYIEGQEITSVMHGEEKIDSHDAIEYFKYANDAGGYYVHGLWIAPTNNAKIPYYWPWDLSVPSGALKDKNDGWAKWGYIQDGLWKNLTSGMNKTFAANGWSKFGVAITWYQNTSNFTDEAGRACSDFSEFPITIEFTSDNLIDVNWVVDAGSIVDISEDNRTITIHRVGPSHVACYCNCGWDITEARTRFVDITAHVTGLTRNSLGWNRIFVGTNQLWQAELNDGTVYQKDKTVENYLMEYGWCNKTIASNTEKTEVYKIDKPSSLDVSYYCIEPITNIQDYISFERSNIENVDVKVLRTLTYNVKPDNMNFWDPIKEYYKNNPIYSGIYILHFQPFQNSNIDELILHIHQGNPNEYAVALDSFLAGSTCEKLTINFDESMYLSSAVNVFKSATYLKEIHFNKPIKSNQFNGAFTFTNNLTTYPADLINWQGAPSIQSIYNTCIMGYFCEYSVFETIPISSVDNPELDRFATTNICIVNRTNCVQVFNGCNHLTYIGPVIDMRIVAPKNAQRIFGCDNLEDARICNLNNGNWAFDGSTVDGVYHGNLTKLNEESVQYLISNLYDLNSYGSDVAISDDNTYRSWKLSNSKVLLGLIGIQFSRYDINTETVDLAYVSIPITLLVNVTFPDYMGDSIEFGDQIITTSGNYTLKKTDNSITYLRYHKNLERASNYMCHITCNSNVDDAVSLVDSAYIKCPSTWDPYITDDLIKSANSKNWTIYVGGEIKTVS